MFLKLYAKFCSLESKYNRGYPVQTDPAMVYLPGNLDMSWMQPTGTGHVSVSHIGQPGGGEPPHGPRSGRPTDHYGTRRSLGHPGGGDLLRHPGGGGGGLPGHPVEVEVNQDTLEVEVEVCPDTLEMEVEVNQDTLEVEAEVHLDIQEEAHLDTQEVEVHQADQEEEDWDHLDCKDPKVPKD